MQTQSTTKKAKLSIHFQGRNLYGYSVFSCMVNNCCRTFLTDSRGRNAMRAAREYFASLA